MFAKRNADITVILHDNGVYGLTTEQFTPTSQKGFKGPSMLRGNIEEPFNPLTLMLGSKATFVARGYLVKLDHLPDIMVQALEHKGFSFVDVLQPCVTFNNTYKKYTPLVEILDHIPSSYEEAATTAKRSDKLPIDIIYRMEKQCITRNYTGISIQ